MLHRVPSANSIRRYRKCCSIAGGDFMSFRNGDKSRENRIRKARQKMREKVHALRAKKTTTAPAPAATHKN